MILLLPFCRLRYSIVATSKKSRRPSIPAGEDHKNKASGEVRRKILQVKMGRVRKFTCYVSVIMSLYSMAHNMFFWFLVLFLSLFMC